jgi:hypothetical protein
MGSREGIRKPGPLSAPGLAAVALVISCWGFHAAAQSAQTGDARSRPELVKAIKHLEKKLGFHRTGNFRTQSDKIAAYYRCYYTGKLELPRSYEGLQLQQGTKDGCSVDPEQYDVFFYPIEAVASGQTPLTATLEHDSIERFLVVVPHEDFHQSKELRELPAAITEASSTLIGFLTASEVARQSFGPDSEVARNLASEPQLFLRKAEVVNRYHTRLSALYAAARAGEVSSAEALAQKSRLFAEMKRECQAISPSPRSFNKCLAADNNAGLAFDMTYTRYYPLAYEVYVAEGRDPRTTIDAIKAALAVKSESEAVLRLRQRVQEAASQSGP